MGTTSSLLTAHNEHHQSPTCPSGHPVTNRLLKPSSRFQLTSVTNSGSISPESGTGPGHDQDKLTRGGIAHYPSSHVCARSETQPNLRFVIRVSGLPASSRGTSNGFSPPLGGSSIHMLLQPSAGPPPPWGRGGRSGTLPRYSREFLTFSPGTSRGRVSLIKYLIGVFFSLLESPSLRFSNGIRHAPFQHWKVFLCYFRFCDPAVNFQRN